MNSATRNPAIRRFLIAVVLVLWSAPTWAYVVLLKDGTQLITREKYRREGEKVFLVLPNGTETFIDAAEVDFEKTDELNIHNVGRVKLIEQSAHTIVVDEGPAYKPESLRDLARSTSLAMPEVQEGQRNKAAGTPYTEAGFVDLWEFQRAVLEDLALSGEIARFLKEQGAEGHRVFQGTQSGRVLVEMMASNESAVFKSLKDAAAALVEAQSIFPGKIDALELVLTTDRGGRAGQFVLTRKLAEALASGSMDAPTFFYRHVQF